MEPLLWMGPWMRNSWALCPVNVVIYPIKLGALFKTSTSENWPTDQPTRQSGPESLMSFHEASDGFPQSHVLIATKSQLALNPLWLMSGKVHQWTTPQAPGWSLVISYVGHNLPGENMSWIKFKAGGGGRSNQFVLRTLWWGNTFGLDVKWRLGERFGKKLRSLMGGKDTLMK